MWDPRMNLKESLTKTGWIFLSVLFEGSIMEKPVQDKDNEELSMTARKFRDVWDQKDDGFVEMKGKENTKFFLLLVGGFGFWLMVETVQEKGFEKEQQNPKYDKELRINKHLPPKDIETIE